ncbi:MAG: DUF4998 domain-containing protein [Bacteroidota bacterium]|nr:DUF4998 domain-containing protein [Bacteroidota bacterium]MDP4274791.1 DUF4998 domain-containing protein [Bacteroidota bacterium]
MKNTFCYILVLFISLGLFNGCKKMDSTYKQYVVPGGLTYAGKANSVLAYAGRNRVKLSWLRGSDPNVTKARVFWNNYSDSVEVNIPSVEDTVNVIIDSLAERTYSFVIKTYDNNGNPSIPVEIIGSSYGSKYQSQILNRYLKSSRIDGLGQISIIFGAADVSSGAIVTEVKYTDNLGMSKSQYVSTTDTMVKLSDYMPGTTFQYRTLYKPKTLSIDTFYTDFSEKTYFEISKNNWNVLAFSSQDNTTTSAAKTFIDGNITTGWKTAATTSNYPHYVTVDMGIEIAVYSFKVYRKTGDANGCNTFQLLVSTDNKTWTDLGIFNFNRSIDDGQLFEISNHPRARYFKFVGLTGPQRYMTMGEIGVFGL